jgi:SAM-dependent methyltransferase
MTKVEFLNRGKQISTTAKELERFDGYFHSSAPRLFRSCEMFRLFECNLGDVLEIGPFYGYTPFILRNMAKSYTVIEGDDPAVYPLKELYKQNAIDLKFSDFAEIFGPLRGAQHKLDLPDSKYDLILCWQTMEHFNFNPVKWVRELYRILKPGGRVCITVPNKASFQALTSIIFGRGEKELIANFFKHENYECDGKKAFYGFHWREYSPPELQKLFFDVGFKINKCCSFTEFQDKKTTLIRDFLRLFSKTGTQMFPRYGTNVLLDATKSTINQYSV